MPSLPRLTGQYGATETRSVPSRWKNESHSPQTRYRSLLIDRQQVPHRIEQRFRRHWYGEQPIDT